jgi:hypothetical protein
MKEKQNKEQMNPYDTQKHKMALKKKQSIGKFSKQHTHSINYDHIERVLVPCEPFFQSLQHLASDPFSLFFKETAFTPSQTKTINCIYFPFKVLSFKSSL